MYLKPTCKILLIITAGFSLINLASLSEATEEYTENEKNSLVQVMRPDLYRDYMKSDLYLIRWLRAKNFNLEDAAKMLRTALKWRKENKIDAIVSEHILDIQSPPFYTDGVDYEKSKVVVMMPGRLDMRRYILAGKKDELIRSWDQIMEDLEIKLMEKVGANETVIWSKDHLVTCLTDLSGYNIRQHTCLSSPRIFSPFLALMKPILAQQTRGVLQIFGSNRNEWLGVVQKIVPVDQVRANFGGTKID